MSRLRREAHDGGVVMNDAPLFPKAYCDFVDANGNRWCHSGSLDEMAATAARAPALHPGVTATVRLAREQHEPGEPEVRHPYDAMIRERFRGRRLHCDRCAGKGWVLKASDTFPLSCFLCGGAGVASLRRLAILAKLPDKRLARAERGIGRPKTLLDTVTRLVALLETAP